MTSRVIGLPLYWKVSVSTFHTFPAWIVRRSRMRGCSGASSRGVGSGIGGDLRPLVECGGLVVDQPARPLPLERGADESAEQRMRPRRPGPELRMRLRTDVERVLVARQLDELDQPVVR